MLHPLRPRHFADVNQAFDALLQFHERSVVGHADDASGNVRAHRIPVLSIEPRIGRQLLEAQRHALLVFVVLEDLDLDLVAYVHQVARMSQASPGHIGDVQQAVDSAHVDEGAVLGEILHHAGQDRVLFQVLERLAALLRLLFFQKLLARDHDVAALLVQLDDGDFQGLTLHAVQIADRPQVDLRAGQKGARAFECRRSGRP